MSPDPDGIERPHMDGLDPKTRAFLIADAAKRVAEAPPLTPETAERIAALINSFWLTLPDEGAA